MTEQDKIHVAGVHAQTLGEVGHLPVTPSMRDRLWSNYEEMFYHHKVYADFDAFRWWVRDHLTREQAYALIHLSGGFYGQVLEASIERFVEVAQQLGVPGRFLTYEKTKTPID